jgi:hypothetical protein
LWELEVGRGPAWGGSGGTGGTGGAGCRAFGAAGWSGGALGEQVARGEFGDVHPGAVHCSGHECLLLYCRYDRDIRFIMGGNIRIRGISKC